MTGRQLKWIAGAAIVLVLIYAWIDGGEEAMRPMYEPVEVPGGAA